MKSRQTNCEFCGNMKSPLLGIPTAILLPGCLGFCVSVSSEDGGVISALNVVEKKPPEGQPSPRPLGPGSLTVEAMLWSGSNTDLVT